MTGGTRRVCQGVHKGGYGLGLAWLAHQCDDGLRLFGNRGKGDLALELEMEVTLARKDLYFSIPIRILQQTINANAKKTFPNTDLC